MLTKDQELWLNHLSDRPITIVLYHPRSTAIFKQTQKELQALLGSGARILHRGATSLGISGQGDQMSMFQSTH